MSICDNVSLRQVCFPPAEPQIVAINRLDAGQKSQTSKRQVATEKNFDIVTISDEGKKAIEGTHIAPMVNYSPSEYLALETIGEPVEYESRLKIMPDSSSSSRILDVTDYTLVEASQKRCDMYGRLMSSWNTLINQLKHESESGGYDYFSTIKLFRGQCKDWELDLQKADPEAYKIWLDKFKYV